MVFALNGTVTLTFDLVTSKFIGVIYWPWLIFLPSTMTVTHKLFKILSGHDVANGRTDRQTDGQTDGGHTIIRPKFYFGRIKMAYLPGTCVSGFMYATHISPENQIFKHDSDKRLLYFLQQDIGNKLWLILLPLLFY